MWIILDIMMVCFAAGLTVKEYKRGHYWWAGTLFVIGILKLAMIIIDMA